MSKVHTVIDSNARFQDRFFVEDSQITIVPMQVQIGNQTISETIDFDSEDLFFQMRRSDVGPHCNAPTVEDFKNTYQEISRLTDQILVLTHSQHLSETWNNARKARSFFMGRCEIEVIDSLTTSAGLGFLAEAATLAAANGTNLEEVVRVIRGVVPRLYSVYYVNSLEYVQRAGLIGEAQSIIGTMLGVKPLLTIESGMLMPMEKARTHAQAVDKLVEFATEFNKVEKLVIMQNTLRITEQTRMLQDRLALAFPNLQCSVMLYEPLLSSLIGPDGMGVIMLESEEARDDVWTSNAF